ncbi:MAG: lipocalin-like domain-containing protein [Prevotella sp.]|nr:lipocalin-like domain-containing protein [Candidatus Equicola faecalis]
MKQIYFLNIIIMCIVASFAFSSCHLEASDNGDLDGFWQLTTVDTLSTGGTQEVKSAEIFWAFQFRLLQVRDINENRYNIRFKHENNMLKLYDPYRDKRESGDEKVTDPAVLAKYGINALEELFTVECLDSEKMLLKSDKLRLIFRRY